MRRRGVAWLLAGAALLACPTAAGGSIPAAMETFGGAWPQGCPAVEIEQGTDPDPTVSGFATPGTCVIYLTPTFLAQEPRVETICAVVVHEFGHLLGLGHAAEESDVMFPSPLPPPACLPDQEPVATAAMRPDAIHDVPGAAQPTTGTELLAPRRPSCARTARASTRRTASRARTARRARGRSCRSSA